MLSTTPFPPQPPVRPASADAPEASTPPSAAPAAPSRTVQALREHLATAWLQKAEARARRPDPPAPDPGKPPAPGRSSAGSTAQGDAPQQAALSAVQALDLPVWLPDVTEAPAPQAVEWAALQGRFAEFSAAHGAGLLTWGLALARQAQAAGEPVAWVQRGESGFYPPDAAANGVDLAALAVVRVPDAAAVARAAERLARSGGFGLIVLDLGPRARVPDALQSLLSQHARLHGTAVLCLTEKPGKAASLSALVALRAQLRRQRRTPGLFACTLHVAKDKRCGPGREQEELRHGPPGLR